MKLFQSSALLGIATIIFSAIAGCTFRPHKEYINPIAPPEPISTSVEVNSPNFQDPYNLLRPSTFKFTFNELTKPIIDVSVTSSGTSSIHVDYNLNSFKFTLNPTSFSEGRHTININAQLATQTGSLAEQFDSEYYFLEKSFTIIIDKTIPKLSSQMTAALEDGFLTVRWGAPVSHNFEYVLERTLQPYHTLRDSIMVNTLQEEFVDQGFVGGNINYTLAANGYGFYKKEIGTLDYNLRPVDFNLSQNDERVVTLNWSSTKLNLQNTSLIVNSSRSFEMSLSQTGNLPIDTLLMAEERNYFIEIYRQGFNIQSYKEILKATTLPNLKKYIDYAMLPTTNKMLIVSEKKLYRYDLSSLLIEDSISVKYLGGDVINSLKVSDDETRAMISGRVFLIEIDPFDFKKFVKYEPYESTISMTYTNAKIDNIELGNMSVQGLVSLIITKGTSRWGLVYNTLEDTVLWHSPRFNHLNIFYPPALSNDGMLVVYNPPNTTQPGEVYNRFENTFALIGMVDNGIKYFRGNELISASVIDKYNSPSNPQFSIYDLSLPPVIPTSMFNKIRQYSVGAQTANERLWQLNYDRVTDKVYTRYLNESFSIIRLYDPEDFSLTKSMKAMTFTTKSHDFSNNYHLTNRGYIEAIK